MTRNQLPPEVSKLFRREREIAEIIYMTGIASAKDVQAHLSDPLTSAAVRSMLNRLVRKGILKRDRNIGSAEFLYRPAISHIASREKALRQLAEDFFGGSLQEVAAAVAGLSRSATGATPIGFGRRTAK